MTMPRWALLLPGDDSREDDSRDVDGELNIGVVDVWDPVAG